MPAKSQAQYRFMQGVAHGSIAGPKGLSKEEAGEYVSGQSPKDLPDRSAGRRAQRKRQARKAKKKDVPYPELSGRITRVKR